MTTFILHGGETTRDNSSNEAFFKCFTRFAEGSTVNILMCYFSKERETWGERLEADKNRIVRHTDKEVTLSLASDPEDLMIKLETHDVLYVAGGDAELIEPLLSRMKELGERLEGKVYLGCSMGAFIVSSQYVLSFDNQPSSKVHKGLGLLPFSTLCHWDVEEEKDFKIKLLKEYSSQSPVVSGSKSPVSG